MVSLRFTTFSSPSFSVVSPGRDGIGDGSAAHGDFYPRGARSYILRQEEDAEAVAVSGFQGGEVSGIPSLRHYAAAKTYNAFGLHVLYHDRGGIYIRLRQCAGVIGQAEVYREAVHAVAERKLYRLVVFFPVSHRMEPVAVGILLRSALVGGEIDGHLTEFTKVAQRQFREKGGESDVRTLAEFIPCHGGSPRSVLVGGGGFFFDRGIAS